MDQKLFESLISEYYIRNDSEVTISFVRTRKNIKRKIHVRENGVLPVASCTDSNDDPSEDKTRIDNHLPL